ncbi:hypothetical protein [Nocardia sp. NPDC127526]|uniref:hypothetical protein n=1 Tax=Nocardia sp. NPDC127526 TaxID=3345393 RepID=UPI0036298CB7
MAQIAALVLAGLGVVFIAALIAMGYSYSAGRLTFSYFPVFAAAIAALFFGRAGSATRVTVIVLGALMILFFLSSLSLAGQAESGGTVVTGEPLEDDPSRTLVVYGAGFGHLFVGILLITTMSQRISGEWFRRPRRAG